jgi:murein DD-endopeptidase MepM/ murein hydrolase activator NlpD
MLSLLLAGLVASQGQALELSYADEPGVDAVTVHWHGRDLPFIHRGAHWLTVVGVDLDTAAGPADAPVTFHYADGRSRVFNEPITVEPHEYPTTRLNVEDRFVELSPEDQSRATREAKEIDTLYAAVTPRAFWTEAFTAPIPGAKDGRNFGHRRVFNGRPRAPHSGADLKAATGTPIHAANAGRIVLAKNLFYSGNAVFIDHGLGLYTTYLHLSRIDVRPGQEVARGQVIGLSGATGRVTGPHLHWGVRILDARVDPFSLLRLSLY